MSQIPQLPRHLQWELQVDPSTPKPSQPNNYFHAKALETTWHAKTISDQKAREAEAQATPQVQTPDEVLAEMQHIIDKGSHSGTTDPNIDLEGDLRNLEELYFTGIFSTGPSPHTVPDSATNMLNGPDKEHWQGTLTEELQSLTDNNVYAIVPVPKGVTTSKMVM